MKRTKRQMAELEKHCFVCAKPARGGVHSKCQRAWMLSLEKGLRKVYFGTLKACGVQEE